jgi:hypothetical protein
MEQLPSAERLPAPPYEPLVEEDVPSPPRRRWHRSRLSVTAVVYLTNAKPQEVTLNSASQHTLEWETPLQDDHGTQLAPGSINLYTWPGTYEGAQLALLQTVMLGLVWSALHLFEVPDPVGAYVIHALIVCNTEASLDVALAVLDVVPRLLLQTHQGQPFCGEGCLHILCANRREEHALRMVDLALQHLSAAEVASFLSTQAVGVFFDAAPMCFYGCSPLSYACVFGLRALAAKMLRTGHVSLTVPGVVSGLAPLHAITANGLRSMYDFVVRELPPTLRADKRQLTHRGRLQDIRWEEMTPLQLTAKVRENAWFSQQCTRTVPLHPVCTHPTVH